MTTFVADAAFIIGSLHTCVAMPCQDYARAAPNVVVVSDGCSSGAHTDLGARQWNLAALDAWNQVPLKNPEQYLEQLLKAGQQRTATMPLLDTLATVAIGAVEDQMLRGFLQGDGFLGFQLADGGVEFWLLDAPGNAPLYPQYLLDPQHYADWKNHVAQEPMTATYYRYDDADVLIDMHTEALTTPYFFQERPVHDVLRMVVATDGIATCGRSVNAVLQDVLAVQDPTGDFMHRRMGAMLRRDNLSPSDDLAIGMLART